MKKINKLNLKLEKLESQKQNYKSLENISILGFIKYKYIIQNQKKVSFKLEKMISLGNEINFWYDTQNNSWIQNPNISCKKYFRLEKRAAYKKNLKLYKLGLSDKKPLLPFLQDIINKLSSIKEKLDPVLEKISSKLPKINPSKFILIQKIRKKYNHLTSVFISPKVNRLAVNTAKIGIKGYRKIQSNCRYIRNSINSKDSLKQVKKIIEEANHQISLEDKKRKFRESLRVSPNNFNLSHNSNKKINITKSKNDYEYSL